jgi:hypothetical protein
MVTKFEKFLPDMEKGWTAYNEALVTTKEAEAAWASKGEDDNISDLKYDAQAIDNTITSWDRKIAAEADKFSKIAGSTTDADELATLQDVSRAATAFYNEQKAAATLLKTEADNEYNTARTARDAEKATEKKELEI